MDNEEQASEALSDGEILFQYQGPIYNRPCGRGICLIDTEPENYLEYVVDGGHYYLEVVLRKLPETYVPEP
jgi:hypothetical protein